MSLTTSNSSTENLDTGLQSTQIPQPSKERKPNAFFKAVSGHESFGDFIRFLSSCFPFLITIAILGKSNSTTFLSLPFYLPSFLSFFLLFSILRFSLRFVSIFSFSNFCNFIGQIGSVFFLVGSAMFLVDLYDPVPAGWLFTFGSAFFTLGDFLAWIMFRYCTPRRAPQYILEQDFDYSIRKYFPGIFRKDEEFNLFMNLFGTLNYMVGSVFFIPSLDLAVEGTWLFISGSIFVFCGNMWKVYRGLNTDRYLSRRQCLLILTDFINGIGAISYFVGSFFFLPEYGTTTTLLNIAASWFVWGAILYNTGSALNIYFIVTAWLNDAL